MPTRPTGTVTFLFTDIEGSTPLWEHHGDAMRKSLVRHNEILKGAIESRSGFVFKFVGDAFQAAFARPEDALIAAIDAQRALNSQPRESWGETGPLRVRMGIHVGPAEMRGDDYAVAHTLNRVHRIMSAANGGQIVLSLAVEELVREHLPDGVELRDLGEHRVKGLTHLEHLFQIVAPDLPADFAALKTFARDASALDRIVHGQLIGRSREMAEAMAQFSRAVAGEGNVLLVSGEPGIGKTRLVRELIAQESVNAAQIFVGECYAEGGAPYAPIAQILRDALTPTLTLPREAGEGMIADLITLAPDLRARFPNVSPNPRLDDPQAEQQRVYESVVAFCASLTARAPTVFFIDDAHWADSGTLFLLRHLARRTRKSRLLTVMTYR
ncbi:MAG: adenylate/guanylate cyclase domain-containing protein, partial [Chloroflexota bacterium]|nr:adenylate/guanylate cyclase domain-containing protein [Chloroflexota bacterium]